MVNKRLSREPCRKSDTHTFSPARGPQNFCDKPEASVAERVEWEEGVGDRPTQNFATLLTMICLFLEPWEGGRFNPKSGILHCTFERERKIFVPSETQKEDGREAKSDERTQI